MARQRDYERVRPRAKEQFVIDKHIAIFGGNGLGCAINADDLLVKTTGHAILFIPIRSMNNDFLIGFVTRQNRRKHNAVIVASRLGIEKRNVVVAACFLELFQRATRGHASADDDQFLGHYSAATAVDVSGFGLLLGFAPCSYSSRKSSTSARYL